MATVPKSLPVFKSLKSFNTNLKWLAFWYNSQKLDAIWYQIDESTSLSQFLAHYSFTPIDKEDTGFQIKGGIKVMPSNENDNSGESPISHNGAQIFSEVEPNFVT